MPRKRIELPITEDKRIVDLRTGKAVAKPAIPIICDRIAFYRSRIGMDQKELASRIGVTANAISNWETGRSRPDVNLLPGICETLRITFYDLFGMNDPAYMYSARQLLMVNRYGQLSAGHQRAVDNLIDTLVNVELAESTPRLTKLMHFHKRLAAGIGDPTEIDDEGIPVYVYSSHDVDCADCIFTINGDSMEPEYKDGQDVLVQRGADLQYGEIGAFIVGNETYIKQYEEDGLHSLNPDYKTMYFDGDDSVYLIGRVIGILDKASYATPEDVEKHEALSTLNSCK